MGSWKFSNLPHDSKTDDPSPLFSGPPQSCTFWPVLKMLFNIWELMVFMNCLGLKSDIFSNMIIWNKNCMWQKCWGSYFVFCLYATCFQMSNSLFQVNFFFLIDIILDSTILLHCLLNYYALLHFFNFVNNDHHNNNNN